MAVSLNDIVRFTQFFSQGTNEAAMVSYWQVGSIVDVASDAALAEAFHTQSMASNNVGGLISSTAQATRTVMDNMTSPLEFGEFAGNIVGAVAGDPMPAFAAILVRQTRQTKATRNGYKRVPFVAESQVTGNTLIIPVPTRTAVEAWFGEQAHLVGLYSGETIDITLVPIIVGRTKNAEGVYEPDLSRINNVTDAILLRPTTQNSRKPRQA